MKRLSREKSIEIARSMFINSHDTENLRIDIDAELFDTLWELRYTVLKLLYSLSRYPRVIEKTRKGLHVVFTTIPHSFELRYYFNDDPSRIYLDLLRASAHMTINTLFYKKYYGGKWFSVEKIDRDKALEEIIDIWISIRRGDKKSREVRRKRKKK